MKVITYIFLYLILTAVYFLALSLFGVFFTDYKTIISDPVWFTVYLIVFHWWLVLLSLGEYYNKYLRNIL